MSLIDKSYDTLENVGSKTPVNYEKHSDEQHLPPWFDLEKFKQCKSMYQQYSSSICLAHLSGLLILVFIRSIHATLIKTGKSKDLVSIFHRYFQTLLHVKKWYQGKIWDQQDEAYISLKTVNKFHQLTSNAHNKGKTVNKDQMAISMRDMTLTQFAFVAFPILHPEKIGFSQNQKDRDTLLYFWAVVGYMLGIEDEYNLCLGDYETVKHRCQVLFENNFRQPLMDFDQESAKMCRQIVVANNQVFGGLRFKSHLKFVFEIFDLDKPFQLNKEEQFYYDLMKMIYQNLYYYRLIAFILNNLFEFCVYLTQFSFRLKSIENYLQKQNDQEL